MKFSLSSKLRKQNNQQRERERERERATHVRIHSHTYRNAHTGTIAVLWYATVKASGGVEGVNI